MPKIDETVIGFAVYEDATEYIGISEVTLPEISNITEEISGAGIGGKIESGASCNACNLIRGSICDWFSAGHNTKSYDRVKRNYRFCDRRIYR